MKLPKKPKKKGYVQFHEVKPDDKFKQSIQVVGLTPEGKELALTLTSQNSGKLTVSKPALTSPNPEQVNNKQLAPALVSTIGGSR